MDINTKKIKILLLLTRINESINKSYNLTELMMQFAKIGNKISRSLLELVFDFEDLNDYSKCIADTNVLNRYVSNNYESYTSDDETIKAKAFIDDIKLNKLKL